MTRPFAPAAAGRVSVIVPMYNASRYLGEALESIRKQTVPVAEVIVVDDGSTDDSIRVAEGFREAVLVRKAHTGICDTLNHGLARAVGGYLAFLDADDRWLPLKTEIQLAALQADPDLDVVFGHAERFQMTPAGEMALNVLPGLAKGCALFRRDAFERAGNFGVGTHDFLDWYARAREAGLRFVTLAEVVYQRRIHGANDGVLNKDAQRKVYFTTLKAALDRRRAAPPGA